MIKFFRKIRQRILSENKFSKYLLYAIGEIILVVIGILIALQINTWNQNRLEKIKSQAYYQRIIEDLDLMMASMNNEITRSKKVEQHIVSALKTIESGQLTKDNKDSLDFTLKNYYRFVPIDADLKSIEELKSSGQYGLIQNKDLRKSIDNYTSYLSLYSKISDKISDDVNDDAIIEKYIFIKLAEKNSDNEIRYDFKALRKDQIFINRLSKISVSWQTKKELSTSVLNQSLRLKEKIIEALRQ